MRSEVTSTHLKRDLDLAEEKIFDAVSAAVKEAATAIRDDAQDFVPQDTGKLHDGIVAHTEGVSGEVGVFDPDLYYGQWVEHGTSDRPAKPFMLPAAEMERKRFAGRIEKHVDRVK